MDIQGKNALVLGGFGLVGRAVCRKLLEREPARLIIGSLRKSEAQQAVEELNAEFPKVKTRIIPIWGDIFLRMAAKRSCHFAMFSGVRSTQPL